MYKKIFIFTLIVLSTLLTTAMAELYSLEIVEYPKEIINERGWLNYFSVILENAGEADLNNVSIYFSGDFPNWFEVQGNTTPLIRAGENISVQVKLSVPSGASSGTYSYVIYAKSKEVISSRSFNVKVFNSKADSILYQIQQMDLQLEFVRINASKVGESGRNVTGVLEDLDSARLSLSTAKDYVNSNRTREASDIMMNVETVIKKAEYDISVAPLNTFSTEISKVPLEISYVLFPAAAIVLIFLYVRKRRKRKAAIKTASKVSTAIAQPKARDIGSEINEIEEAKKLVEDEFKQNLISKESYDELMAGYEKKLSDLREGKNK